MGFWLFLRRTTILFHCIVATALALGFIGFLTLKGIWDDLPNIRDPQAFVPRQSIVITDRSKQELYRFYNQEDRTTLRYSDIPRHTVQAFVAIEDKRYFERGCLDWRALARAAVANITDYKSQGASTLTQQLVRAVFLTNNKTVERKVREIMLACQLESEQSKEQIAELYFNWIAFGHGIAGLKQASQRYFGIEPKGLSIAQSAVLAAMPQRPTYLSPYGPHKNTTVTQKIATAIRKKLIKRPEELPDDSVRVGLISSKIRIGDQMYELPGRANIVVRAMHDQGYISAEEATQALVELETLNFSSNRIGIKAPHFSLSLKNEVEQFMNRQQEFDEYSGLHVRSTIHSPLQELAEQAVGAHRQRLGETFGANNAALIAVDLRNNEILAYVGNTDFFDERYSGQLDMIRIPRQTGSSFKPIVYASLLEQGHNADSYIYDTPLDPRTYVAHTSGYYGRMTIRTALARSRNTPAIRAFFAAGGEDAILQTASAMGVDTPRWYRDLQRKVSKRFQYNWTLALGAAESSLLEMAQAYSVFARGGEYLPIIGIKAITDANGEPLLNISRYQKKILQSSTAEQITSILSDEEARESDWRYLMHTTFPTAVKTGTSTICLERSIYGSCKNFVPNNTWTLGYSDRLLVGVWVGNVSNQPMSDEGAAVSSALPLWKDFMERAHPLIASIPTS